MRFSLIIIVPRNRSCREKSRTDHGGHVSITGDAGEPLRRWTFFYNLLRSRLLSPMQLIQLFVQYDAAHDTMEELGNLGVIQFVDVRELLFSLFFDSAPLRVVCSDCTFGG